MKYIKGYKYQLQESTVIQTTVKGHYIKTAWIELMPSGALMLHNGYAWNGASGALDTNDFMKASAAHDALYQLIGLGLLGVEHRAEADKTLVTVAEAAGMPWWRRQYVYWAVRLFGCCHLEPEKIREV
jgi:hypothetical protein